MRGIKIPEKKKVIIINGKGGVGKDTICTIVGIYYNVLTISSIDPIKKIAFQNGWDGTKDEKSRRLLSELKRIFIEFNDLPTKYCVEKYHEFMNNDYHDILFVHIREPEEIDKFRKSVPEAKTLLIRRDTEVGMWHNPSDDCVENYTYDYVYDNDKSLEEMEDDFMKRFKLIVGE